MARSRTGRLALLLCSVSFIAACEKGGDFNFLKKKPAADGAEVTLTDGTANTSVKLVERDVEAPEVFEARDKGLWDGRPSLGGVWVAHSGATDPERVIIRNEDNGKFVIGALFKRERENPGPAIQVSSDAASALGMVAGAPDQLNVTALRRQEVPIADEVVDSASATLPSAEEIQTASLDPIASAGAALDKIEADEPVETASLATTPVPAPKPAPSAATAAKPAPTATTPSPLKLSKQFIQIGYFSVEENANNTGTALRNAGVVPTVKKQNSKGKTYYRVVVGPATNIADRALLLKKVKGLGFADAYFVTN